MDIAKVLDTEFLNRISFFNFANAITAAFYADQNLNLINVNKNFENLFKTDIELKSQNLLTLLAHLGVEQKIIITHHAPNRSDKELDQIAKDLPELFILARDGLKIEV